MYSSRIQLEQFVFGQFVAAQTEPNQRRQEIEQCGVSFGSVDAKPPMPGHVRGADTAAVFSASNALLARFGAAHRKRCGECIQQPAESQQPGSGVAIALGNALDAVPEAMVLGIALRDPVVPFALVVAFSLGNLPVAL